MSHRYYYFLRFSGAGGGLWHIAEKQPGNDYASIESDKIVFSHPYHEGCNDDGRPPKEVRDKYEALTGRSEFIEYDDPPSMPNLVEMMQDGDSDCAWDQPCAFGHRVEDHAVYCRNEKWLYAPTKCHRRQKDSWLGEAWPHQQCPGFKPNPILAKNDA